MEGGQQVVRRTPGGGEWVKDGGFFFLRENKRDFFLIDRHQRGIKKNRFIPLNGLPMML